jgi:phosphatidylglycerophosphate synthase
VFTRAYLVCGAQESPDEVVGGLPILLRQALSLQDAGVREVVVVGHRAASLRDDSRLRITVRERPATSAPSDQSAEEDAIVAGASCVWHPAVARRLARTAVAPGEVVAVGSGRAVLYACGRSRVNEIVAAVFANADADAQPTIADVTPTAARLPEFVVAADTAAGRRAATSFLLQSLHKPTDGLASRHLHRRISVAITRRLLPYRITPNQMTLLAAFFGVAGVLIAFRGGYWHLLLGAALFETQNILDGCDGEISRLKYLRSRAGEWLDQIIDDALNIAFLSSVGLALARSGYRYAWWLTLVALASHAVHMTALYSGLILKAGGRGSVAMLRWWVGGGKASTEPAAKSVTPLRALLAQTIEDLTRRDLIALAYVVAAALNVVSVVFVWHVLVTFGSAIVAAVQWIAWGGPELYSGDDTPRADAASEVPA